MKLRSCCFAVLCVGCAVDDPQVESSETSAAETTESATSTGSEGESSTPSGEDCVAHTNEADCRAAGCTMFQTMVGGDETALVGVENDECVDLHVGVCLSFPPGAETGFNDYPIEYGMPGLNVGFSSLLHQVVPDGWLRCDDPEAPSVCDTCFGGGESSSGTAG